MGSKEYNFKTNQSQEKNFNEDRNDDDDDLLGCHGESILLTDTERY